MLRHLADAPAVAPGAERLTGVRREVKYLLTPAEGAAARDRVAARLPAKLVDGVGYSFRSSVYLDVPGLDLSRAALAGAKQTIKLRVKDYYRIVEGRLEYAERCWLEVKLRAGPLVEKSRFPVARTDVRAALGGELPPTTDSAQRAAREAFEAVRAGRALTPLVVAHYRRWTFQDPESRLRVTFDDGVTFHLPPRGAFEAAVPICARPHLPPPLRVEPAWIVEIKSLGLAPRWIDDALGGATEADYSKFESGVRALAACGEGGLGAREE